jgi:HSP20 family molecular chaperone IbpA
MLLQRFKEGELYFDDFTIKENWEKASQVNILNLSPTPALNIIETVEAFYIELVVPGLTHEDLIIKEEDGFLLLKYEGQGSAFEPIKAQRHWLQEHRMLPFMRQIPLNPNWVSIEDMKINSINGITTIRLSKQPALLGKVTQILPVQNN